jgi:hypothetical protein
MAYNKDIGHYHPGHKKQTIYTVKEGYKIPFTNKMIVTNSYQVTEETQSFPTQGCAPEFSIEDFPQENKG